jgi:hypothetical protein
MKTWNTTIGIALLSIGALADDATVTNPSNTAPAYRTTTPLFQNETSDMSGRLGLGVIFGEPTGVSLKYFFTDSIAIDGGAGWAFHHHTDFHLHSDILWHDFDLIPVPEGKLPLYLGVGARLKVEDHADDRFGIRVPVGVSYFFERLPIEMFGEVAPVLDVAPSPRGGLTAGVGVRWWF